MPKYSINKMRSAGLRYLVVDKDGQAWAFEPRPHREYSRYWVLPDDFLPTKTRDFEHWARVSKWNLAGRTICMPVFNIPVTLTWDDEPYDIVNNGLVAKEDFKVWPDFRSTFL